MLLVGLGLVAHPVSVAQSHQSSSSGALSFPMSVTPKQCSTYLSSFKRLVFVVTAQGPEFAGNHSFYRTVGYSLANVPKQFKT